VGDAGDDRQAGGLEAAFLDNRAALLRFLRARGAGDAAEDLLQELWLKAVIQPSGPISQPLAYLYRMANNLMLDRLRSELRSRRREQEWTEAATPPDRAMSASGERVLLAQEELRAVEATLSALGERTDAIFRRFRLDGATQHQIAQEMGISLSAVEKHLQKAYRALVELRSRPDAE
jgi:RNA polymerase sigma factor (sigma-70 family)